MDGAPGPEAQVGRTLGWVDAVLCGRAVPYTRPGTRSAIAKQAVAGPVAVGTLGLTGDEQGDTRAHGGPDKAVHHYAFEHYAAWRDELGVLPVLSQPGAFGENLSTHGVTESSLCLGDRVRAGSVLLEVSQSRQPCWRLNDRFGVPDMARRVQQTSRTGWYYRVLEPGTLQAGDALVLVARPWGAWPLARLIDVLYHRPLDAGVLQAMSALPLTPSWRRLVDARLARGRVEDWSARMDGVQG
jgi:MOSC domain-containing protein YiiM